MSSITPDLEISFERKVCGAERLRPSLLPRWLYETTAARDASSSPAQRGARGGGVRVRLWLRVLEVGLMPAETRKSTTTDFILVWPLLKSSPPIIT